MNTLQTPDAPPTPTPGRGLVLLTGARGFIGRHLAQRLAARGHRVLGLGHGHWPEAMAARHGVHRWLNGDIHAASLHALCGDLGPPELVFHLAGGASVGAAIANPREDFDRTVTTTANLLEWLRLTAPDAAVVAVSSAAVYGGGHPGPIREGDALTPYSPYGHHKLMMESLCRSYGDSYGLRSVAARLFSVYGAGLQKQLLWDLCGKLEARTPSITLGGSGDELRDWIAVDDVVSALLVLAGQVCAAVPAFNVGSGLAVPVREVATRVMDHWAQSRQVAAPTLLFSGQSRPGDPFSLHADIGRLQSLGLAESLPLDEGLARYVAWYPGARDLAG